MSKLESNKEAKMLSLSYTELKLTKTFLLLRICIYFFVLPTLRSIWPREPLPPFAIVSQLDIHQFALNHNI